MNKPKHYRLKAEPPIKKVQGKVNLTTMTSGKVHLKNSIKKAIRTQ